ncbi:hypothetical protein ACFE04_017313 [Oxalis oulophora]
MVKLSILATSFALLVVIATASVTITTIEIDEPNPSRYSHHCQEQLPSKPLKACREFLMDCSRRMDSILNMSCRQQKQDCCQEMEEMDKECRCQAIMKMMHGQEMGGRQMEQMAEKAMELPRMCNMSPGRCEMRRIFY